MIVTTHRRRAGLEAVRYYTVMPDAETQRLIAAMGDTIEIIAPPAPVQAPSSPNYEDYRQAAFASYENCNLMDTACVMRNAERMGAAQQQFVADRDQYHTDLLSYNARQMGYPTTDGLLANDGTGAPPPMPYTAPVAAPTGAPAPAATTSTLPREAERRPSTSTTPTTTTAVTVLPPAPAGSQSSVPSGGGPVVVRSDLTPLSSQVAQAAGVFERVIQMAAETPWYVWAAGIALIVWRNSQ